MQRWRIDLAYNGENFHGWQVQPNAISIQDDLEKVLTNLLQEDIHIIGCGRTDSGVHAGNFVAHFDTEKDEKTIQFLLDINKVNELINKNIAIYSIQSVEDDFNSRFDAKFRTYHYYISTQKEPLLRKFTYLLLWEIDFDLMNEACKVLLNYTDFTSFSKLHTQTKTNNCNIEKAEWRQENGIWIFEIKADRFLRNMVRSIVGTLLDVGRKKITIDDLKKIIELKDRNCAGVSVPAHALFLHEISY